MLGDVASKVLVGTFHGVCNRMLRMYGVKYGVVPLDFSLLDQQASGAWVKRAVDELKITNPTLSGVDLDPKALTTKFAAHKNENGFESRSLEVGQGTWKGLLDRAFQTYQTMLKERGLLDFADLLHAGLRLAMCPEVQNFLFVSVDEFQDTNRLQFALAKQWSLRHGNVLVVGDMEQSIYVWRGATPVSNFSEFFSHFKNSAHGTNYANYRSTQSICAAANSITANSELFSMRKVKTELKPMVLQITPPPRGRARLAEGGRNRGAGKWQSRGTGRLHFVRRCGCDLLDLFSDVQL